MNTLLTVANISEESQTIVEMFFENYQPNSSRTYLNAIRRLQEETNLTDFTELTSEQYDTVIHRLNNRNSTLITSFVRFLYCNDFLKEQEGYERYYWDKEALRRRFDNLRNNINSQKAHNDFKRELSLKEIEKLCSFEQSALESDSYENIRLAFCFHALFFDGLPVDILKKMDFQSVENGVFVTKNGEYIIPEEYLEMVGYYVDKRGKNTKLTSLNLYITSLGNMLNIKELKPKTISQARDQNLFKCPECGEKYLAFSQNWMTINGKMICFECAKEYAGSNQKKNNDIITMIEDVDVDIFSLEEKESVEMSTSTYNKLCEKLKKTVDFDSWNEHIKLVGKIGEKYILEQEKKKLESIGRYDLAELVDGTPALDNTNGFDILSYCPKKNGKTKKYIEVKTTEGSLDTPFYLSAREKETAESKWKQGEIYEIHRVYNLGKENIDCIIYSSFEGMLFEDVLYKAIVK